MIELKIAKDVYKEKKSSDKSLNPINEFSEKGCLFRLYEIDGVKYFGIRGTTSFENVFDDFNIGMNQIPRIYVLAYRFLKENNLIKSKDLIIIGHSLGGSVAQYLCSILKCKGVTFNAYADSAYSDITNKYEVRKNIENSCTVVNAMTMSEEIVKITDWNVDKLSKIKRVISVKQDPVKTDGLLSIWKKKGLVNAVIETAMSAKEKITNKRGEYDVELLPTLIEMMLIEKKYDVDVVNYVVINDSVGMSKEHRVGRVIRVDGVSHSLDEYDNLKI
ncbi:MAG: hypothetical protein ACRC5M_06985 [Anaeroplasmataceae bacterium]